MSILDRAVSRKWDNVFSQLPYRPYHNVNAPKSVDQRFRCSNY